jgi:glycosyltransferase involved in cell wall biosynthesis
MDVTDLRIAMFTGNYNIVRDGANQALNQLVDFLQRKGAKVRVYSPVVRKPDIPPNARIVKIPAVPVPGRTEYRAPIMLPARAMRDIRRYAPNIFHIASPEILGHRAVSFARELDIPVVASVHTRFETYFRYYGLAFLEPIVEAALRRLYRRCDAIFAPSESMAQLLREQRMNYIVGIWSRGIDREIFDPQRRDYAWRRSIGVADDVPVIGFVGRIVMEKGLDVYSDAIDLLERRQIRHRVLVVGEGPARGWFEKRLPSAIFVGHQTGAELGRAVASMDLLFNPSITETFGNVTLEAMAVGLPVVAASATGSLSLVSDGVTGRLVRPGAIYAFADALSYYCQDEEARLAAGRAGIAFAQHYGWDEVNQELVEAYIRTIRQHAKGGLPRTGVP